jgi:16S rRNA (cytidine1402-2'-O)-methyltransferase
MSETSSATGTLFVVATPIGNLEDITLRALRILREARAVAAEDTRHTRKLLSHYEISARLISLNADAEKKRIPEILEILEQGGDVAIVSDAGTPGSSDPGGALVAAARRAGLRVSPVPGASAVAAAISTCGAATDRFAFEGFLPRSGEKRRRRLDAMAAEDRPVVLFESPRRVLETLADLHQACGADRVVSLHREQTKVFEEILSGSLEDFVLGRIQAPEKGEYTIVVMPGQGASDDSHPDNTAISGALDILTQHGLSTRDAVAAASAILGASRSAVYDVAKKREPREGHS